MTEVLQNGADDETNDHHGVPRSFLGSSDSETNLTTVLVSEHKAFHAMAGHRPPASFLRRALLSSVNWHDQNGKMLPAGLYKDMLPLLTPHDWQTLYQPGSIRKEDKGNGHTKAAVHVHLHLWEEQGLVAQAIGAVGISRFLSREVHDFREKAMIFFHEDNPASAMRMYLTDKNDAGERKWTKPLRPDLHSELCNMVKRGRLEAMSLENRKKLLHVLHDHHEKLNDRSKVWKPSLGTSIDDIAEYGQERMELLFKKYQADTPES